MSLMPDIFCQTDNTVLLKQAKTLELKFDEADALSTYKMMAANDPSNVSALVKCTEFYCSICETQKDKKVKFKRQG